LNVLKVNSKEALKKYEGERKGPSTSSLIKLVMITVPPLDLTTFYSLFLQLPFTSSLNY
jgi:hypothetical protein